MRAFGVLDAPPTVRLLAIAAIAVVLAQGCRPASSLDRENGSVVFVCRNGVAMSVWSALMFERLAAERGLRIRAASRAAANNAAGDSQAVPAGPRLSASYPRTRPLAMSTSGWDTGVTARRSSKSWMCCTPDLSAAKRQNQ